MPPSGSATRVACGVEVEVITRQVLCSSREVSKIEPEYRLPLLVVQRYIALRQVAD